MFKKILLICAIASSIGFWDTPEILWSRIMTGMGSAPETIMSPRTTSLVQFTWGKNDEKGMSLAFCNAACRMPAAANHA